MLVHDASGVVRSHEDGYDNSLEGDASVPA